MLPAEQRGRRCRRFVGCVVLCASVCGMGGCAAVVPEGIYDDRLHELPQAARDHVHIILVESIIDPTSLGGLPSVEAHLASHGFTNVSRFDMLCGETSADLADRIRRLRRETPSVQVMLVGWSAGCTQIYNTINDLRKDGTYVDSVVYLDSLFINVADLHESPNNVGHHVLIYRHQRRAPRTLPNSDIYRIPLICHYSIPTEPTTLEILHNELVRLVAEGRPCDAEAPVLEPEPHAFSAAGCKKPSSTAGHPGGAPRRIDAGEGEIRQAAATDRNF